MTKVNNRNRSRYDLTIKSLPANFIVSELSTTINASLLTVLRRKLHNAGFKLFVMRKRHLARFVAPGAECKETTAILYNKMNDYTRLSTLVVDRSEIKFIRYAGKNIAIPYNIALAGRFTSGGIIVVAVSHTFDTLMRILLTIVERINSHS